RSSTPRSSLRSVWATAASHASWTRRQARNAARRSVADGNRGSLIMTTSTANVLPPRTHMYAFLMARARGDVDYYAVLGLAPGASDDEIRRTYRRLALQWHPDRNRGDARAEERFKEISEA